MLVVEIQSPCLDSQPTHEAFGRPASYQDARIWKGAGVGRNPQWMVYGHLIFVLVDSSERAATPQVGVDLGGKWYQGDSTNAVDRFRLVQTWLRGR